MNTELKGYDQGVNIFDPDKEFFVIQSDDLESVQTAFYGFCVAENTLITEVQMPAKERALTPDGAYVYIKRDKDMITVRQDFVGCYGLYLYRNGNYWALGNSFHYLVDHIKQDHTLTFNQEYADHLLVAGLAAQSYSETLMNEIEMLDRSVVITIDIRRRTIETEYIDYEENTLDLDSPEGMAVLDKWVGKWTGLIRYLKANTDNIRMDLSGGYDTRLILSLFLASGIDLNEIWINSNTDGLHCHAEDYEIAGQIADYYKFGLNDQSHMRMERTNFTLHDSLAMSFDLKLGFHTQMYWQMTRKETPIFAFSGSGIVRDLAADLKSWKYEDSFIENQVQMASKYGTRVSESVYHILSRSFESIKEKFHGLGRTISSEDICYYFYRETRTRNHFGKAVLENFWSGSYKLCPLLDCDLNKIKMNSSDCEDRNLLVTVIFNRYSRDLLKFKIEGGRFIEGSTIAYAGNLNVKYPFVPVQKEYTKDEWILPLDSDLTVFQKRESCGEQVCADNPSINAEEIRTIVEGAFRSQVIKKPFEELYGTRAYYNLTNRLTKTKFFPESDLFAALAIGKVYYDCTANSFDEETVSTADFMMRLAAEPVPAAMQEEAMVYHPRLLPYITARIDIKNRGAGNDIEILAVSDRKAVTSTPAWFEKDGKGYVIESNAGSIAIQLRCIQAGRLDVYLRSRDIRYRDHNRERIPYWIDYQKLSVNDRIVFDGSQIISHDFPYTYTKNVDDGEIVTLHIAWQPHDETLQKDPYQESIQKELRQKDETITELKHDLAAAKRGGHSALKGQKDSDKENRFDPDKEFFVIQSDNLESVQTQFYGYCITKTGIILDASGLTTEDGSELTGEGTYVSIHRNGDQIKVRQDYFGCYGLYLYRDGDFWAISNSFQYLVDQLKYSHAITFNKAYADHLITMGLCAAVYRATLVQEIQFLDRSAVVDIAISARTCTVQMIDYHEHTVALNSAEGMALLDGWYAKWTALIRSLKQETDNISTDLSGGFDSRMVFNLFAGSGIDCSSIYIHTITDKLHTHAEDWVVANQIADHYGFKLNRTDNVSMAFDNYTQDDVLNLSLYPKLGFHKQMYWKLYRLRDFRFIFNGAGGEGLRSYWSAGTEDAVQDRLKHYLAAADAFPEDRIRMRENIEQLFSESLRIQEEKYCADGRELSQDEKMMFLYRDTRARNHFGKARLENFYGGMITFSPLLDQDLCRLCLTTEECSDRNLLMALMFTRYNEVLAEIPFEGGRSINASTLEYARRLSDTYPVALPAQESVSIKLPVQNSRKMPEASGDYKRVDPVRIRRQIRDSFFSCDVRRNFEKLYAESTYRRLAAAWDNVDYFPDSNAYAVLSIAKIYADCEANAWLSRDGANLSDYIRRQEDETVPAEMQEKALLNDAYLSYYKTARIDLKNRGSAENDIRILEYSDLAARIAAPGWYCYQGKGYTIHTDRGTLKLKLACVKSGVLHLNLLAMDVRDKENHRIPFWIDYTSLKIDGREILPGRVCAWHDRPYVYEMPVEDGQQVSLETSWTIHNDKLENKFLERQKQYDAQADALRQQIKDLQNEKQALADELQAIKQKIEKA